MRLVEKQKKTRYVTVCIYEREYDSELRKTVQVGHAKSFTVHEATLQEVYETLVVAIKAKGGK